MTCTTSRMQWPAHIRSLNTLLSVEELNPLVTYVHLDGSFEENIHVS